MYTRENQYQSLLRPGENEAKHFRNCPGSRWAAIVSAPISFQELAINRQAGREFGSKVVLCTICVVFLFPLLSCSARLLREPLPVEEGITAKLILKNLTNGLSSGTWSVWAEGRRQHRAVSLSLPKTPGKVAAAP